MASRDDNSIDLSHRETAADITLSESAFNTRVRNNRLLENNQRHLKALTGIRFIAAAAVVLFHSGSSWARNQGHLPYFLTTLLLNGYIGVTFFFVLSGFILQLVYRGQFTRNRQYRKYFVARLARVYPVYLLGLIAMMPFVQIKLQATELPQFILLQKWMPNTIIPLNNWNMPAWTLSVELFFYLLFPVISSGARRSSTKVVLGCALSCAAFIIATRSPAIVSNTDLHAIWMRLTPVPVLRLPEFLLGISLAELKLRKVPLRLPSEYFLAGSVICAMVSSQQRIVASIVCLLSGALILKLIDHPDSRLARLLGHRLFVTLGGASYSLYLLHQPVHFSLMRLGSGSRVVIALQYPLLVTLAIVVFYFIEEPAREWIRERLDLKPSAFAQIAAGK